MISLCAASSGLGQSTPAPDNAAASPKAANSPDIVVTGRKRVEKKEALKFTRSISAPVEGQLARFHGQACPTAIGFPPAVAEKIVARMRDVAEAARVSLAKTGCSGNLIVIASNDGSDVIRQLERRQSGLVTVLAPSQIRALIADRAPVHSWAFSAAENQDGIPASRQFGEPAPTVAVYTASHMNPTMQQSIKFSVVVIDWSAMTGKSTTQIADYAAMRTLANTRAVEGDGPLDTILALFDQKNTPPAEISAADLAYLQSLYRMPGMKSDYFQVGQISNTVKKASAAP